MRDKTTATVQFFGKNDLMSSSICDNEKKNKTIPKKAALNSKTVSKMTGTTLDSPRWMKSVTKYGAFGMKSSHKTNPTIKTGILRSCFLCNSSIIKLNKKGIMANNRFQRIYRNDNLPQIIARRRLRTEDRIAR